MSCAINYHVLLTWWWIWWDWRTNLLKVFNFSLEFISFNSRDTFSVAIMRLDSKTNSVTLNNTFLNNFEILNKLIFKIPVVKCCKSEEGRPIRGSSNLASLRWDWCQFLILQYTRYSELNWSLSEIPPNQVHKNLTKKI